MHNALFLFSTAQKILHKKVMVGACIVVVVCKWCGDQSKENQCFSQYVCIYSYVQ